MKIKVYSLEGEAIDEMELPEIFNEEFRPDVIKRAVLSAQTARVQPWGPDPMAGKGPLPSPMVPDAVLQWFHV